MEPRASYLRLLCSGELGRRVRAAREMLSECRLCPHECAVDRLAGELGVCRTGAKARVASYGPHFGEEAPLVGRCGSGTVFFSGCNLRCVYCQNWDISQRPAGEELSDVGLATVFLEIAALGCHNLNLVSPSHVLPQILAALELAGRRGFDLPLVWNCGGYESLASLALLDGVVDIYMPDAKYSDPSIAESLSGARDYPQANRAALREMHRQVGSLRLSPEGIAERGVLIRHLVLPGDASGSEELARFVAEELSPHTYVNVMGQYRPCYMARSHPELDRRPTLDEIRRAAEHFRAAGLYRLDGSF